jgi:DNA-binding response OmpR family regulator
MIQSIMDGISFGYIERSIADVLAHRFERWVPTSSLIDAAYGLRASGGPEDAANVIKAHVHAIRRKIKPHGLLIEGKGNIGRRMIWKPGGGRPALHNGLHLPLP